MSTVYCANGRPETDTIDVFRTVSLPTLRNGLTVGIVVRVENQIAGAKDINELVAVAYTLNTGGCRCCACIRFACAGGNTAIKTERVE